MARTREHDDQDWLYQDGRTFMVNMVSMFEIYWKSILEILTKTIDNIDKKKDMVSSYFNYINIWYQYFLVYQSILDILTKRKKKLVIELPCFLGFPPNMSWISAQPARMSKRYRWSCSLPDRKKGAGETYSRDFQGLRQWKTGMEKNWLVVGPPL